MIEILETIIEAIIMDPSKPDPAVYRTVYVVGKYHHSIPGVAAVHPINLFQASQSNNALGCFVLFSIDMQRPSKQGTAGAKKKDDLETTNSRCRPTQ